MQYFQTPDMKALGLPFSAAVRVGDVLYLSGALGNVPGTLRWRTAAWRGRHGRRWRTSAPCFASAGSISPTSSNAR